MVQALSEQTVNIGAWAGMPWVDPVVGLVIAAVIIAVLINSMRTVVRRLMDGIDTGTLDLVESTAAEVPGVVSIHRARARWSGHRLEAELEITVDSALTVRDSHAIAAAVQDHLHRSVPHLDHASIHTRPEGLASATEAQHR